MAIAALIAGIACEKKAPPTPSPGPDTVETIRGTERLGWDQSASGAAELATFRYAVYIDGARSEVTEVSCGSSAGTNGFACSARLPPIALGQHTIELAAFTVDSGTTLESPRSAPLRVNVTASSASAPSDPLRPGDAGTTSDGVRLQLDVAVDGLEDPSDIAFAPDGRLFIAERRGRLHVVTAQQRSTSGVDGGEILALGLDTDFERTRFVYVAHASRIDGGAGSTFMVARYREANGVLGERMVLLHGVPASPERASAALGVGPDGKLYVALDDGGEARLAGDAASLNGKLLRLNRDGTTPDDQQPGTPVQGAGYRSPRGLGWSAGDVLWIADGAPRSPERLNAVAPTSVRPHRSELKASYALAQNTDPADALVYRGDLFTAFRGNVLIGAEAGSHILRVRLDPRSLTRVVATEKLLEGVGAVRALAVGPDGAIYFATATSIGRLSPRTP